MRNNYFEEKPKIPTSIKIYFLILHLVFGQDFGFGNLLGKKITKLLEYHSAALALTTFVILIWPLELVGQQLWYWCAIFECVVNFCILKVTKHAVFNFISDIHATERIDVLENQTFGAATSIFALVMFTVKGIAVITQCMYNSNIYCEKMNNVFHAFYSVCCHALDLMPHFQIVVRFYIYAYVKNMGRSLKQDKDINKFVETYNKIADLQDKIRSLCDYSVSIHYF